MRLSGKGWVQEPLWEGKGAGQATVQACDKLSAKLRTIRKKNLSPHGFEPVRRPV
jgi:hypothetical protein